MTAIAFEVDDQTPEDLAIGLDKLRQHEAVLDVSQSSVAGKKGRLATSVQVLCRPEHRDGVVAACFEQTTTIGLRWQEVQRAELFREGTERAGIAGKTAARPDGTMSTKPEIDDVVARASTQTARAAARARFTDAEGEPM